MKTFDERCYDALRRVPRGKVTTYGQIAKRIGARKASRAVGGAMNRNPHAPHVPCHRVVRSNGELGGYAKGIGAKIRLLKREGILLKNGRVLNLKSVLFKFR